ncbi:MAG: ATP-dependent DNA ligase [Nanoarchaeota archaeon]|nr:ATP-dependent DNA ligase [Nanoarchaeota archaeon]
MQYAALVGVYRQLASTSKRLEKTRIIAELIKEDSSSEVVLLLQGRVFPNWDDRKIGVASRIVIKAISKASGQPEKEVEQQWKKTGDLGLAAQELFSKKSQSTLFSESLTVKKVYANLTKLASAEGQGAVEQKLNLISQLLTSASPEECRYLTRTVLEDLRVGVGEGSMRDAIVWAFFPEEIELGEDVGNRDKYNEVASAVQEAYDLSNDFSEVAERARQGIEKLRDSALKVGKPLKVMLAIKAKSAEDGLERVGIPAAAEYKLDGFRIQVHKAKSKITLFTRRLEDVTTQFPDVVAVVSKRVTAESCILDCEAVGYSPETKKYLPFQSISQRIRRKYNIEVMAKRFPVELNVFDVLSLNGETLLKSPFKERRKRLESIISPKERELVCVKQKLVTTPKAIDAFFRESLKEGNEGLMLKALDAPYKPGARVGHMVKLKETMENLDLVIIGAEWGEGKRSTWLSSFVVACRDEDGNLLEVGRVSTGLKEKREEGLSYAEMTDLLQPLVISEKGKEVKVKPEIVIEVAYEEIQKSPTYKSGYALRFPRVIRQRTEERGVDDISSLDYVQQLYDAQK